jgi:hypothetical protein
MPEKLLSWRGTAALYTDLTEMWQGENLFAV